MGDNNYHLQQLYKNHLCLHCQHLSYWDWYICTNREFKHKDYYFYEIKCMIKRRLELIGESSWKYIAKHIFDIDQFIPDKPVTKCKQYEYSSRERFWL